MLLCLHFCLRPTLADGGSDFAGKGRLAAQHPTGQNERHWFAFTRQFAGTMDGVLGQHAGRAFQNIPGDPVALAGGGEYFQCQCRHGVFVGGSHPVDEVVRFIRAGGGEQPLSELAPSTIAIEVKHARLQGS